MHILGNANNSLLVKHGVTAYFHSKHFARTTINDYPTFLDSITCKTLIIVYIFTFKNINSHNLKKVRIDHTAINLHILTTIEPPIHSKAVVTKEISVCSRYILYIWMLLQLLNKDITTIGYLVGRRECYQILGIESQIEVYHITILQAKEHCSNDKYH